MRDVGRVIQERDFPSKTGPRVEEAVMPPKIGWLWVGLLANVIAGVSRLVVHSNRAAAQQRQALASFSQSVVLGMPRNEVDRKCKEACLDNAGCL